MATSRGQRSASTLASKAASGWHDILTLHHWFNQWYGCKYHGNLRRSSFANNW